MKVISKIVLTKPDLANAKLVEDITQIATYDPDSWVHKNAQMALAQIAESRPDLIDANMVNTVAKAVRQEGARSVEKTAYNEKLVGWSDPEFDNEARRTATQTLETMKQTRPDLFAKSQAMAQSHGSVASHSPTSLSRPCRF